MYKNIKKIFFIIDLRNLKVVTFLVLITLFSMCLEAIGIGLILPIFSMITNPEYILSNSLLKEYLKEDILNIFFLDPNSLKISKSRIIIITGFFIVIIYSLKNILSFFSFWLLNTYIAKIKFNLSNNFFEGYLDLPYSLRIKKNSSYLTTNILRLYEVAQSLENIFMIFAEFFFAMVIIVILINVDIYSTLFIIFLFPTITYLIFRFSKFHLINWQKKSHFHFQKRLKLMQEAIQAFKDIKILGRSTKFIEAYNKETFEQVKIIRNEKMISVIPRYFFEIFFIFSLFFILYILNVSSNSENDVLPRIILFAVAGLRLLPSINRFVLNFQSLRTISPVINLLYEDYLFLNKQKEKNNFNEKIILEKSLKLKKINFSYENSKVFIFKNLEITIKKGDMVGIVGESGTGKTTLVDMIMGLLPINSGSIEIDDKELNLKNMRSWQNQIGYIPQNIFMSDDTIKNNIAFGLNDSDISMDKLNKSINFSKLTKFIKNLPNGYNTIIGEAGSKISGGQKQRIGIARALYSDPKILIFDEATSSLDPDTEREIMSEIKSLKKTHTIIIISHKISALAFCDKIFKINNKNINEVETNNKNDL